MIDLHLHTTFSDGNSEAEDLIREAVDFGLEAIAITDHDNTESYEIAVRAAEGQDIEVIEGIEINTVWHSEDYGPKEVHVLGYYIDRKHPQLREVIDGHRDARIRQIKQVARNLKQAGVNIDFEEIAEKSCPNGCLGRPHVARTIVEKGGAPTINEAFRKFLNRSADTYVLRETASPHDAVEAIYESGGIPVIAHPHDLPGIDDLVVELMDYGLGGLEAYHRRHSPALIEFHCTLAEKYNLIVTGGTDYHGPAETYQQALAKLHTPDYVYEELKKARDRRNMAQFKVS